MRSIIFSVALWSVCWKTLDTGNRSTHTRLRTCCTFNIQFLYPVHPFIMPYWRNGQIFSLNRQIVAIKASLTIRISLQHFVTRSLSGLSYRGEPRRLSENNDRSEGEAGWAGFFDHLKRIARRCNEKLRKNEPLSLWRSRLVLCPTDAWHLVFLILCLKL